MAGVITAVEAEPGQVVNAGTPVVRIAQDGPRDIVFSVPEDRQALVKIGQKFKVTPWKEGLAPMDGVVRDRIRMALNGHVLITVIIDEDDEPLGEAWVELMGLPETGKRGAALADQIEEELAEFLARAPEKVLSNDDKMDDAIRKIARQVTMEEVGKKPEVTVVVSRLIAV